MNSMKIFEFNEKSFSEDEIHFIFLEDCEDPPPGTLNIPFKKYICQIYTKSFYQ
jgi:hypothetical protein